MKIFCVNCNGKVQARLTNGQEIYPHRTDLAGVPFWICDECKNYVGCHYKTKDRTRPLGCIPTPQLREARRAIHALLDPMWQSGKRARRAVYKDVSDRLGYVFHSAEVGSMEEALHIYQIIQKMGQIPPHARLYVDASRLIP